MEEMRCIKHRISMVDLANVFVLLEAPFKTRMSTDFPQMYLNIFNDVSSLFPMSFNLEDMHNDLSAPTFTFCVTIVKDDRGSTFNFQNLLL